MQGLGAGRGSQRHKAVLSLADKERNTFVFTVFGELPGKPREYLGESRTLPSRRRAARTDLAAYMQAKCCGAMQTDICALIGGTRSAGRWPPEDGQPRMPVAEERRWRI